MRTIIFTVVCAVCLSIIPLHAAPVKADTLNIMRINYGAYEDFNGKELEGKTIVEYNTSVSTMIFEGKRQLVKVHQIRTADYKPQPGLEDMVLYIDGEIVDKATIDKLEAKDIESMVVNKSEGTIRVFLKHD